MEQMTIARDSWPGVDPAKELSDRDQDLRMTLEMRLAETDMKQALDGLTTEGCDSTQLREFLFRIRRSADWERISKDEVTDAIKVLRDAERRLVRLKRSELGRRIFERLARADQLVKELDWVIAGTKNEVDEASAHRKPRTDSAWSDLVSYVKSTSTTGKYHDEQVSMLITGALDLPEEEMLTADNLRQWRHRRGLGLDPIRWTV